jgi:TonB family protein
MSATPDDVPPHRTLLSGEGRGGRPAAAASLMLHALVLGGVVIVAVQRPAAPPVPAVFAIVFAPAAPAAPVALAEASVQAAPVAAPLTVPAPLSYTARRPRVAARRAMPHAASPTLPPAETAAPAAAAPAPARPVPPDTSAARAALMADISRAVNEAKFYPSTARLMHRQGRAQISFAYVDGAVAQVALAQSSHVAMLDEAALAAVRRARYPRAAGVLAGQTLHVSVWLDFSLVGTD